MHETRGSRILDYFYDSNGQAIAVRYKNNNNTTGTYYYYAYNSRGDIVGLYDESGSLECTYTYDAWGNILSVKNPAGFSITSANNIANLQSLKYRGYVYDNETGLYYLQSRYYDPVTHRFINADGLVSTGTGVLGYNMFAYVLNSPVSLSDSYGNRPIESTTVSGESKANRTISCKYQSNALAETRKNESNGLTHSKELENLIKEFETLTTTPTDFWDGTRCIGYGHIILEGEQFTRVTDYEATQLMRNDLAEAERMVLYYAGDISWDQNEFDALVDLYFNGGGNSLLTFLNDYNNGMDVYTAFTRDEYDGVFYRREAEANMFLYGIYERKYH